MFWDKEASKKKRARNREWSTSKLRELGVNFKLFNNGAHLVIFGNHGTSWADTPRADFWPGTGKYKIRGQETYKRGVHSMLRELGIENG